MKEDKNKRSGKGKAIISIVLAAIIFASIFGALAPTSARDATGKIEPGDIVYQGERLLDISDVMDGGDILYGMRDSTADGGLITVADVTDFVVLSTYKLGPYNKTSREGLTADLIIDEPEISAGVFIEGTNYSIVGKTIPAGTKLTIRACTNFGGLLKEAGTGNWGKIKIKLYDPDGIVRSNPIEAVASEITVGPTAGLNDVVWEELSTDWWDTGVWKVKIKTDKCTCNDLDISSAEYGFTVCSEELSIEAEEDEVGLGEDMILTVYGNPITYYYLIVTNVNEYKPPRIKDVGDAVALSGDAVISAQAPDLAAWIKTGSDGIADVKIDTCGADTRTYTIKVYDDPENASGTLTPEIDWAQDDDIVYSEDDDDVQVTVVPATVMFDVPATAVIGDIVDIKGAISAGDQVDIVIRDVKVVETDEHVDEYKEFSVEWDTSGYIPGSCTIEGYIDFRPGEPKNLGSYEGVDPDGYTTIRLISYPYLDASLSKGAVPIGDSFEIYGNASFDYVEIVAISPNGGNGTGMEGLYGVTIYTVPTFIAADTFSDSGIAIEEKGDGVWVTVSITFDIPSTCIIGENLTINGSASEGNSVDIAMDDIIEAVDIPIENGTFYTVISTAGYFPSSYTIEGFIDGNYSIEEDVSGEESDGTTSIRLIEPGLTAEQPKDEIARGSFYVVRGTATGVDEVDIAIIGPKGLTENKTGIEYGFALTSSSVSESEFEDDIFIPEDAEEGEYTTFILSPGRDCVYAATEFGGGELEDALEAQGYEVPEDFVGKSQEQIIAMIKDATINVAGSDDLYVILSFRVDGAGEALNSFYKKIKVDGNADTGNYTVLVLSPSIDGVYGDSYYFYIDSILDLDGAGPEPGAIDVSNKTQEEIISIIENVTIDQAGSDDLLWTGNIVVTQFDIFDTGESSNPYPSISGTHNGTIEPSHNINVSKLYTYPCIGTGGHTESIELYENGDLIANGTWNGYVGDWHNITLTPSVTLWAGHTYNYTIVTGSYPQIIHETPSNAVAEPTTFFGEDSGLGEDTRLTSTPNADAARADFLAQLTNPGTENFESFDDGEVAPLAVDFGAAGTATLQGTGDIEEVPDGTNGYGRYPISGDKYWDTNSSFSIEFSEPQVAFGFYGVDVGDFSGQLTITYEDGSTQTITIPHTVNSPGGTVIYFGFIDTDHPFITLTFGTTTGDDVFGFDDFTIGTIEQVVPTFNATGGTITCTEFTDANGNVHYNWIPSIRLWSE